MDLSSFKLLKEDQDNYEIGHPSGKKLTVSKSGLSKKAHEAIKKYAVGGVVEGSEGGQDLPANAGEIPNVSTIVGDVASGVGSAAKGFLGLGGGSELSPQVSQQEVPVTPDQAISGTRQAVDAQDPLVKEKLNSGTQLDQEIQDQQAFQKQISGIGNQSQNAVKQFQNQQGQTAEDIVAASRAKDEQLENAFLDKKIDPDRFWKNQSTGSKIAAGIGLLFSGIGSGVTGGPNLAMEQINKAIENDIDAQKNDQSKSMNIWKMNREALGNDLQAHAATQNQYYTALQAKMLASSQGIQNAELQLKVKQAISDLQEKKNRNNMLMGLYSQGQSGQGGMSKADPLALVPELVPEAHQKDVIGELGKAKAARENEPMILEAFDQAAKDTRPLTGRSWTSLKNIIPGSTTASKSGLATIMDPLVRDNDGKINEITNSHVAANYPALGDSDERIAQKRATLQSFINEKKTAPTAQTFGINPQKFSSTASTETPVFAMRGGIQYQKVPGGWKRVQ